MQTGQQFVTKEEVVAVEKVTAAASQFLLLCSCSNMVLLTEVHDIHSPQTTQAVRAGVRVRAAASQFCAPVAPLNIVLLTKSDSKNSPQILGPVPPGVAMLLLLSRKCGGCLTQQATCHA